MRGAGRAIAAITLLLALAGRANPVNPSFTLAVEDARTALAQMKSNLRPLDRTLVIVGGYQFLPYARLRD